MAYTLIDIGGTPANYLGSHGSGSTYLYLGNTANATGILDSFQVWAASNVTGLKIGTWYGSSPNFTRRDYETIGSVTSGALRTFTGRNCDVTTGDYLGFYWSGGTIEKQLTGGSGVRYVSGDKFDTGESVNFNIFIDITATPGVSATGFTVPDPPTNVLATDYLTDRVTVTWTKGTGATGNYVYRNASVLSSLLGDVVTYDDTTADAASITPGTTVATDGSYINRSELSMTGTRSIQVGHWAGDYDSSHAATSTFVFLTNPASGTGVLTDIEIYATTAMTACKVGTFSGSGTSYTSRDYETLGSVSAGKQTFTGKSIDVVIGDYIGWYSSAGNLDKRSSGGSGAVWASGDKFGTAFTTTSSEANSAPALYASIAGLTGTNYTYTVYAYNAAGLSTVSNGDVGHRVGTGLTYQWQRSETDSVAVYTEHYLTAPTTGKDTTVNSTSGSIVDITSTSNDPWFTMYNLGSYDPTVYKYINIRYKVVSGTAGTAEIFFLNSTYTSPTAGISQTGSLISDNAWHDLTIDMSLNASWTTGGNITGWRFDWCSASGVNMQINFIEFTNKPTICNWTDLSSATAQTYSDTGAPSDGSARYYRCVQAATGVTTTWSTPDRGWLHKFRPKINNF